MATFNSTQYTAQLASRQFNLPQAGGGMFMWRAHFKAPTGGLAIADLINFGLIRPGLMFNPGSGKIVWTAGTATSDLNLGHTGFSNIDDAGVVSDISAAAAEFLSAGDLGAANLAGSALLNARVGGIYVSDRNAAGTKVDGVLVQGVIATAVVPANQVIAVEIPVWHA